MKGRKVGREEGIFTSFHHRVQSYTCEEGKMEGRMEIKKGEGRKRGRKDEGRTRGRQAVRKE